MLDGPGFPIVAEGSAEPNDTYVDQLTASARAAVEELDRLGMVDPKRICVAGHRCASAVFSLPLLTLLGCDHLETQWSPVVCSYGAFMAAGLLAHAPGLFACGVGRSGAYNRTMTP